MDAIIETYLKQVQDIIDRVLTDPPNALVLVGSFASDDAILARSDVDLLVISAGPLVPAERARLAGALSHSTLPCPAHGLDLIVYASDQVREPSRVPRYDFSLATGPDWEDEVSREGPYPEGLIDLAAAGQFGRVLRGPPVSEVIGPIPQAWIREELERSLNWHVDRIHDPFHDPGGANAVLNACRALHFCATGYLVSKTRGAAWFREAHDHADLVNAALAWRRGSTSTRLERRRVEAFLAYAVTRDAWRSGQTGRTGDA